jgi:glucose-6-phosphate isomerase
MTLKVSHKGKVSEAVNKYVPELVKDQVASRLFAKDHTLWGKDAEAESSIRLGWVDAAQTSLALIPELISLSADLKARGLSRVVLCGMGGSSLAPEVITNTAGVDLIVLDSTDPSHIRQALDGDLTKTVVVVSSKSGSTVETDSQKRSFEAAFDEAGIAKTERIFIVTDPDSPMHVQAIKDGYRVFLADPMVGGRYSALTAFGIVPTALAGVDVTALLNDAIAVLNLLSQDLDTNPGLILGAAIARTAGGTSFKDKLGFVPDGTEIVGFGDWVEQLIAESTGKLGRGILPIVLDNDSFEVSDKADDTLLVGLSSDASISSFDLAISGELGELLLLWEVATAVASRLLGVNPFDQPDVESAKIAARAVLDSPAEGFDFKVSDKGVEIAAFGYSLSSEKLSECLSQLVDSADSDSYLSIHCYLNREKFGSAIKLRELVAQKANRPTTFGWGPRFLHSTGQYHKGGPKQGVFIQIVSGEGDDQEIPGRQFGYRKLIDSQAGGDAKVLASGGSKVLVLRLLDVGAGIQTLTEALK